MADYAGMVLSKYKESDQDKYIEFLESMSQPAEERKK